ncbi:heterokaryon incompatibility protein-domain-containing protein [Xylaria sp. FL1777]|nr:heterokaryon incompatibility protein-domain-containing protein [Xylaria sp. FL1777]
MAYLYRSLPESMIRLLVLLPGQFDDPIRCEIIEAKFSSDLEITPSYEALSYVWGSQTTRLPAFIVDSDGTPCGTIGLGSNLYVALQHLRREQLNRVLWCDFVCINQVDLRERAREVARMGEVYSKAERAVIWLGPERDENVPYSQQEVQAIKALFARNWFKRLWVRQEVILAKSSVVIAGNHQVSWMHFVSAAAFMDSFIRLRNRGKYDIDFGRSVFNVFELGCLVTYQGVLDIMHACRACECSDDRDRIYALLGLLSVHHTFIIQPDYSKPIKKVYRDLMLEYARSQGSLDVLTLCEDAEKPSWVPDLHKLGLNTGLNTRVVQYCRASGEAAAFFSLSDDNAMETYGVRCGVLGRRMLHSISKNSPPEVLKQAITRVLRKYMGDNISQWDEARLETLTKGLLGCLWRERTGRKNHSSIYFALSELKSWALESASDVSDEVPAKSESLILINHIARVLFHGDSCRWTQDGHLGLGFHGCEEGDLLYAILGCRRLIALRKETAEVKFKHKDGLAQWQDPRLQDVALPPGWRESQDHAGYPYWFRMGSDNKRSYFDPRLTPEELKKRNINLERLVIV